MPGLVSLLSRRTMNPRAGGAAAMLRNRPRPIREGFSPSGRLLEEPRPWPVPTPPWGGKDGGYVKGYQGGGATGFYDLPLATPEQQAAAAAAKAARARAARARAATARTGTQARRRGSRSPGGWQLGGEVGAAPEEVAMASEIFARATPEQQDQITGGGGGPGMMDEEAAIGEALAMAMGGGGGGPPMNGGGPPMGGPPMGGPPMNGAPPLGGMI